MKTPEIVGIYELFDAVEAVVKSADPAQRKALAQTIDAYADDFPDEFYWAVGPQAPTFLSHLLFSIDTACGPEAQSSPGNMMRRGFFGVATRKSGTCAICLGW
jgi:hypothetical protein